MTRLTGPDEEQESLAVLLLPGRLEGIACEEHARGLLSIPRVLALEPPRLKLSRFVREGAAGRQASRLRLPGEPRLLVLYHPAQYPLARALCARYEDTELWYIPPGRESLEAAEQESDDLARARATQVLEPGPDGAVDDASLRGRLRELGVISPYAFVPGARARRR